MQIEIWYFNEAAARDALMGRKKPENHVALVTDYDRVWDGDIGFNPEPRDDDEYRMAAENLFAAFQDRREVAGKPLAPARSHTSMSVGDVVRIGDRYLIAASMGFEPLPFTPVLL